MFRILTFLFFLLIPLCATNEVFAQSNDFISIVNPIRGNDFWDQKDQKIEDGVIGEAQILKQYNLPATWLLRFDALGDENILKAIGVNDEKGLFLEVVPSWVKQVGVTYHVSASWHNAGSAFLTGYEANEREKLIDAAFERFKTTFGYYPKSVGAWWIDSYSLGYMQKKYGIITALIVADQYSTDNYQIWGQYFSTPYYPSKKNALHPAQSLENKLPVVITQWAPRDPVNAYGNGVYESTFSVQANDYIDYHDLDIKYFSKLLDIYTKGAFNKFSHLVVGLENSYIFEKYKDEYQNQIKILMEKRNKGQISLVTLKDFANWYISSFPDLSPPHLISADDPLGSDKKVVWFMNPYYRAGWFYNQDGSVFRDIRQYIDGEEELCFKKRCDSVNFATSATRVLDEVSFGHKLIIDEGKITDFNVKNINQAFIIRYKNEVGRERQIEFLPRDINIDGKISSIDTLILEATKNQLDTKIQQTNLAQGDFKWSFLDSISEIVKFLFFLILGCFVPGFLLINKVMPKDASYIQKSAVSLVLGFTTVTLLFYLLSIFNIKGFIIVYPILNLIFLIKKRNEFFSNFSIKFDKFNILIIGLICLGTIFQQLPTFKNGLYFPYGYGFWGPNTHDGIWHISLINQLVKDIPPQNPIFAGEALKNYHYFYDLLVAATHYLTQIPVLDLLFRFYPIIFSAILGIGTFYLIRLINTSKKIEIKLAQLFGIYLVYFSGSFGWIVEYIKVRHLGGESAFWANQSISFNLNPPFAISLLIVITILQLLPYRSKKSVFVLTILCGTLIAFKSYGAILILLTFLLVGILKKNLHYLLIFLFSGILSAVLFLSNFSISKQLIIFSPFWFIHSMVDSPDRVGWTRLTLARVAGLEQGNWFKFFAAEIISLAIFIIGNLGTRLFALFSLIKIKNILGNIFYLFLFTFSLLSLFIPIFFIQAGNPWNTIQFIYYFLYVSAVVGGLVLAGIITKRPRIITILLCLLFLVITPINSWATANGYLSYQPHALISNFEIEALNYLKFQKDGIVLTYPYDKNLKTKIAEPWPLFLYDSTAYVSALSNKGVYIEDEGQNQILLTDYKKRLVASKGFFAAQDFNFFVQNNIQYIYLPKIYNIHLNENKLKKIYDNEEVIIYQVKNEN